MNFDWRTKRKALYLGVPILIMLSIALFLTWSAYSSAACDDGRQNGGELGIDCEGPCPKICLNRVKPLSVKWVQFEEVESGRYNVMALLENLNEDLSSEKVEYTVALWNEGEKIWENEGESIVPAGTRFGVFEGPVRLAVKPTRATIELKEPVWSKTGEGVSIDLVDSSFSGLTSSPSLEAIIRNRENVELKDLEVAVALLDNEGNAAHVSRTVIPSLASRGEVTATFTWPRAFEVSSGVCLKPFSTMLLIDRSGSMNEDSVTPPEPLESVKKAALSFAERIGSDDKAGLVTFATDATLDVPLAASQSELKEKIQNVSILPEDEEGYTNIGDALRIAREAFSEEDARSIILLTDGKPNWPLKPTGETYALEEAQATLREGIPLYVIGLGSGVGRDMLNALAGDASKAFEAPSVSDLTRIYSEIGTRLCDRKPYQVEIYPKVLYGQGQI